MNNFIKKIFMSLLVVILISQNLSPVMYAEENPGELGGISENGEQISPTQEEGEDLSLDMHDSSSPQPQLRGLDGGQPLMAPAGNKASITLSTQATNLLYSRNADLNIKVILNQPTTNTKLYISIPDNLVYRSHLIADIDGLDPVDSIKIENSSRDITIMLKDNLVGELNMNLSVFFPSDTSYQGEEATINVGVSFGDEEIDKQSIMFIQSGVAGITFTTPVFNMTPNSIKKVSEGFIRFVGNGAYSFGRYSNVHVIVPFPDEITITGEIQCVECASTSYDAENNIMHLYYPSGLYRGFGYIAGFNLLYTGSDSGTFIASNPITVEGLAGGQVLRTYTGNKLQVDVKDGYYSVKIDKIHNNGNRQEFLSSSTDVSLYSFYGIQNNGFLDIGNLGIEIVPPKEVRVKAIQVPSIDNWGSREGRELEIKYDTNLQTNLSKKIQATSEAQKFGLAQLGLSSEEYITRIKLDMKNFNSLDTFSYYSKTYSYDYGLNFTLYGDVLDVHSDGTPIQEGEKLITQKIITIDGVVFNDNPIKTTWTKIPYLSDHASVVRWYYSNGPQYSRGDTVIKTLVMANNQPLNGNGGEGKNPYIYLIVNDNLELDTDLSHWTTGENINVVSVEDVTDSIYGNVGYAKAFKVTTETELTIGSTRTLGIPYVVKNDAMPGTYNDENSIYIAFDSGYYATLVKDSYGLLGPVNENSIKRPFVSNPNFTIVGSSYGMSSRIKSPIDHNRKAGYDAGDESSLSIITDNVSSIYRQIFFNESSENLNNLEIVIPLPQENDGNGSQWRGILSGEVEVDGAVADITYSSNGTDYQAYSAFTNPSQIENIKLNIATRPAKSQVIVDTDIIAAGNPSDGQIAKISSEWTYSSINFNSHVQAMVYHPSYTVTIESNNTAYGDVSQSTITLLSGTTISINSNKINLGTDEIIATPKTNTAEYRYEFENWTNNCGDELTHNCNIIANFTGTQNNYTVTFVDEDGTVLKAATAYDYGTSAANIVKPTNPTKAGDAQYSYTFAGWSPAIANVTENATYTATYSSTVNQYDITFVDEDGTVLKAATAYDYGTSATNIVKPTNPTKAGDAQYSYTFAGWTPSLTGVKGAQIYTATYTSTINKYTVRFVDEDGTEILSSDYDYGTVAADIIKPADPSKNGFKFEGWIPSVTDVTGNAVYKAEYKKESGRGGRSGGGGGGRSDSKCERDCECKGNCDDSDDDTDDELEHGSAEEVFDMHKWVYENGLTIYAPGEDAKFDQPLTRQQMAKISSIFGTDFLGQKADASERKIYECSQYADLDKLKGDMKGYVIHSCLMKNMGYHYDNVSYISKFKPYDKLSVAQASIILSRMAWGTKYVISPELWYQGHMQAVYEHRLIDDISDPKRYITRGEAFMMMYRLGKMMNSGI